MCHKTQTLEDALSRYISDECVWDASEKRLTGRKSMVDYWTNYHASFKETLGKPEKIVFGDREVYLQVRIRLDFLEDSLLYGKSYNKGDALEFGCADFYELDEDSRIRSGCVYIKFFN